MDEATHAWLNGAEEPSSTQKNSSPSTMEEGYRSRFGSHFSSSPPAARSSIVKPSTPTVLYNPTVLKTIGQQCSRSLPPANAVQAMFLYEMQRQSESERLFKNQMFLLARNEDESSVQQGRIEELEAKVAALDKAVKDRDVQERMATSRSTMQMLGVKLAECTKRVEVMENGMHQLSDKMAEVEQQEKERKDPVVGAPTPEENTELVTMMKQEIDVLFDDRDGILRMIKNLQERLAGVNPSPEPLEEVLPPVTNGASSAPRAAATTNRTTASQTQRLPLRTASTSQPPMELSVPKGQAAVGLRASNHAPPPVPQPSNLRTFSPGKPWAS